MGKEDIIRFNHIDKNISPEIINEIKSLYRYYHRRWWCYLKAYKHFRRLNIIANVTSASLVVIGTIAGGITLNPIVLGIISGSGLLLKTLAELKNYPGRSDMCEFGYTTYQKALGELQSCLRGSHFEHNEFINKMRILDEVIIDMCPPVSHYNEKYDKKFTT